MKKWIIIVVIVAMFGWAVYDFVLDDKPKNAEDETAGEVGLLKGNIAPDFELETVDGEVVRLSDFRGEKVLLNFWATWCPPCRAEMPDMQQFHEEQEGVILAVNLLATEQSPRNVEEFLDEYGITFKVLSDKNSEIATLYNASALPTSYLINTKGEIHNIAIGALNYELMEQAFSEMD